MWQYCLDANQSSRRIRFPSQTRIWEDRCIHPDDKSTPSGRSSEFKKFPAFQYIHPDDVAILSGRQSEFEEN